MDTPLHIAITSGTGIAPTHLAAFDAALHDAGIANLNLITLSSVIPPGAVICGSGLPERARNTVDRWGDRLYCVLAEGRAVNPGQQAWAGLSWWQAADDHRGLFVEQHADTEEAVRSELELSIRDCVARRGLCFDDGRWGIEVNGVTCTDRPVCALVAATYETHTWGTPGTRQLA